MRALAPRRTFRAVTEISDFGAIVLLVSAGLFLAVLGMRLADRISLPNAALFLLAAGLLGVR